MAEKNFDKLLLELKNGPVRVAASNAYPESGTASVQLLFVNGTRLRADYWRVIKDLGSEVRLVRPRSRTTIAFRDVRQRNFVCVSATTTFDYFPEPCGSPAYIVNQTQAIQSRTAQVTLRGNGFTDRVGMKGSYGLFAMLTNLSSRTQILCPFDSEAPRV